MCLGENDDRGPTLIGIPGADGSKKRVNRNRACRGTRPGQVHRNEFRIDSGPVLEDPRHDCEALR